MCNSKLKHQLLLHFFFFESCKTIHLASSTWSQIICYCRRYQRVVHYFYGGPIMWTMLMMGERTEEPPLMSIIKIYLFSVSRSHKSAPQEGRVASWRSRQVYYLATFGLFLNGDEEAGQTTAAPGDEGGGKTKWKLLSLGAIDLRFCEFRNLL